MRSNKFSVEFAAAIAILGVTLVMAVGAVAQTETVLYSFKITNDSPKNPHAGLVFGGSGNLYGTTSLGGTYGGNPGYGTVFELAPAAGGGWMEKDLHNFGHGTDGIFPAGGVIFDKAGNLYGTTQYGGTGPCGNVIPGCGTVFELSPKGGGGWTEQVLYSFQNSDTGTCPYASLVSDAAGNLYGTTWNCLVTTGTAFELVHKAGGWKEQVLYNFDAIPAANLILDAAGNLYGTTANGGSYNCGISKFGCGTVFELSPKRGGGWSEKVLHSFRGTDGESPYAGLIFDAAGNLYGTTLNGGAGKAATGCQGSGCGVVFELTRRAEGGWKETVLYSFGSTTTDGAYPYAGLVLDAVGNLYGTTSSGGNGFGTVFELLPATDGSWTETTVYYFQDNGADGESPYDGVIFDAAGNLYGTTEAGGYGYGTVFEITP